MLNGWLHSVKTGFGVFESRNSPIYCVEWLHRGFEKQTICTVIIYLEALLGW